MSGPNSSLRRVRSSEWPATEPDGAGITEGRGAWGSLCKMYKSRVLSAGRKECGIPGKAKQRDAAARQQCNGSSSRYTDGYFYSYHQGRVTWARMAGFCCDLRARCG